MRRSSTLDTSSLGYLIRTHSYPSPPFFLLSLSFLLQTVFRGLCCNRDRTRIRLADTELHVEPDIKGQDLSLSPLCRRSLAPGCRHHGRHEIFLFSSGRFSVFVGLFLYLTCRGSGRSVHFSPCTLSWSISVARRATLKPLCIGIAIPEYIR